MNYLFILFLLIICINKSLEANEDTVTFVDIHTSAEYVGDAIIIQSKGKYAMIDVGKNEAFSYQKVLKYLTKNNKYVDLEWILFTHYHGDHVYAIRTLLQKKIKIKTIYAKNYGGYERDDRYSDKINSWNNTVKAISKKGINLVKITGKTNPTVKLGNFEFHFLNVKQAFKDYFKKCNILNQKYNTSTKVCNENSNSIIAIGKNKGKTYYFSGDIENFPKYFNNSKKPDLKKIFDNHTPEHWVRKAKKDFNINQFDVFKLSHHGFLRNNNDNQFKEAKPKICIIPTSYRTEKNQDTVIDNILAGNPKAKIFYTGAGTVTVKQTKNGKIKVTQDKDEHKEKGILYKKCDENPCSDNKNYCCFKYGNYCVLRKNVIKDKSQTQYTGRYCKN